MSEKLFRLLFQLYPSHFRKAYGKEALQLFRDRARDERGFLPTFRLWMDMLADFAIAIPRAYREGEPVPVSALPQRRLDGVPSFQVLEDESLPAGAFLLGSVAALLVLGGVSVLINRAVHYRPHRQMAIHRDGTPQLSPQGSRATASGNGDAAEMGAQATAAGGDKKPTEGTSLWVHSATGNLQLDALERRRVVDAVTTNLRQHYFDTTAADKTGAALLAHEKNGDYNAATDGASFAALLTTQMREVSHDMHLELVYSRAVLPDTAGAPPAGALERYRNTMQQQHCTFEEIEILPHNIGYLKLNSFPDPAICQSTATDAMARLNDAHAIIFDLRDNSGGYPAMVSLIAAYLFDHPEYMYSPRGAPTDQSWTRPPQLGNNLADKPAYILTSSTTWSGAEQFSYDLKMLKRATLVGETTRGGAHAGVFHRIDDHFGIGIPEEKVLNPFGKADWEGTGVEPDVKVRAADALPAALKLAENELRHRH
jgi:Peptidase family S41